MDYGVFIFATAYAMRIDELAVELEDRGFESLFQPEHTHIPASRKTPFPAGGDLPREYSNTHDPFVSLSFAAHATKTLKVGTAVCLVPQHDPIVAAKSIASLDLLSGGRFVFGIGAGWNVEEMENHGVEHRNRFKQMGEHVKAMKAMWTQESASFHGEFVNFDDIWLNPKPAQSPNPPILLGGETDYTLARIVDYCDGWMPRASPRFDPVDGMARMHRMATDRGRDPANLSMSVFRAPDDARVLESYAKAGVDRVIFGLPSEDRDSLLPRLDALAKLIT
jgi:probable F420-dependent oxidoreductase